MTMASTADDFAALSWHDNLIYGMRFDLGDTFQGDWHQDLVFDIDYIAEWLRGADGGFQFKVAPATLTFHQVMDLRIDIDFGDSGCRTGINEPSIADISRQLVDDAERFPARDYYRWRIALNVPPGGAISFGARGFTQTLRAAPLLCDAQRLPAGAPR